MLLTPIMDRTATLTIITGHTDIQPVNSSIRISLTGIPE
jgi:hypothetical protein